MYLLFVREDVKKHPILKSVVNTISHESYKIIDIRNLNDIIRTKVNINDISIFSDPIVFLLCWMLSPVLRQAQARKIFLSLEMFEYQRDNNKLIFKIRNMAFKFAHEFTLKKTDVVFPNQIRASHYERFTRRGRKVYILPNLPSEKILRYVDMLRNLRENNKIKTPELNALEEIKLLKERNYLIVVYTGSFNNSNRSLDSFIRAFSKANRAVLFIAGKDQSGIFSNNKKYKNVKYLGDLRQEDVFKILLFADFGLANYSTKNINTRYAAPVKIFEYKLFGLEVLCNRNPGVYNEWGDDVYYFDNPSDIFTHLEYFQESGGGYHAKKHIECRCYEDEFRKILNDES